MRAELCRRDMDVTAGRSIAGASSEAGTARKRLQGRWLLGPGLGLFRYDRRSDYIATSPDTGGAASGSEARCRGRRRGRDGRRVDQLEEDRRQFFGTTYT